MCHFWDKGFYYCTSIGFFSSLENSIILLYLFIYLLQNISLQKQSIEVNLMEYQVICHSLNFVLEGFLFESFDLQRPFLSVLQICFELDLILFLVTIAFVLFLQFGHFSPENFFLESSLFSWIQDNTTEKVFFYLKSNHQELFLILCCVLYFHHFIWMILIVIYEYNLHCVFSLFILFTFIILGLLALPVLFVFFFF